MIATLILLFWLLSFVIGAVILSDSIAENPTHGTAAVLICFLLFAFNVAYTVMAVSYSGIIKGLQKQLIEQSEPNKLPEKSLDIYSRRNQIKANEN